MKIIVRKGHVADGLEALDVLHRSISELCIPDHDGDEKEITDWLSNKTESTWWAWLSREDAAVLVAEKADKIVGVGMIDQNGEVLLNYVLPDARFSGVSTAVLDALESEALKWGLHKCFLESTKTAWKFYERSGYSPIENANLKLQKLL